eukprot:gnl/MRDRNA2_/MRDRNA2_91715_c0_seq1.p1 gnl/MRDRNA2_/MRDRNA2_91715_c0~~gnl/MRDRNA2_/MRDRNA2_91715_c0_seq1.p1  ORF type:complete len:448 (+),score=97.33 gnl/MRDRNA2_/MRDRNA2_91715_c0_seq1:72-1415(+)
MAPTQPPQERLESLKHWLGLPSEAERAGGSEAERAGGAGRVGALRRLRSEKQLSRPQSAAPSRTDKRHAKCESFDVATMPGVFGERLRGEANNLRSETEALRKDRDKLRAEVRLLHEEAAKLHSESADLRQENTRAAMLRDEAVQLRTENADLRAEAAALRAEGAALRHENAELRGEGVALRRSRELLQCERSALACGNPFVHDVEADTVKDCEGPVPCMNIGLSGGAYCWPEEQQMRWRLRQNGMAEESQDEMKLGDVVHVDCCRIQAGDPIQEVAWTGPAVLSCPSPSRQAQRMRPCSAGSFNGSHSMLGSGFADVTLKHPPVPPLLIPDPGVPVQDLYEQCHSGSDDDDDDEEERMEDEHDRDDDHKQVKHRLQDLGPLHESLSILSHISHPISGAGASNTMSHGTKGAAPSDLIVTEPCGSSARPPRAKGSHSLEVRPAAPMC